MFNDYYKKDIEQVQVSTKLREQLARELFSSPSTMPQPVGGFQRMMFFVKKPMQYFSLIGAASLVIILAAWVVVPTHVATANDSIQQNIVQPILATVHVVRIIRPMRHDPSSATVFIEETLLVEDPIAPQSIQPQQPVELQMQTINDQQDPIFCAYPVSGQ